MLEFVSGGTLNGCEEALPVEIEEEHDEMETELEEGLLFIVLAAVSLCGGMLAYLLVDVQLAENLSRIQEMRVVDDPAKVVSTSLETNIPRSGAYVYCRLRCLTYLLTLYATRGRLRMSATQYPLTRKRNVRKPWTAASGIMYVFNRLQRSMGLM